AGRRAQAGACSGSGPMAISIAGMRCSTGNRVSSAIGPGGGPSAATSPIPRGLPAAAPVAAAPVADAVAAPSVDAAAGSVADPPALAEPGVDVEVGAAGGSP